MPESLFIDIEFLKILISFYKCSWVSPINNTFSVVGDFEILKEFLPENNYRTKVENTILINITICSNKIIFQPEDEKKVNKVFSSISDLNIFKKIDNVLKKEGIEDIIERLLFLVTIYATIEICKNPYENKLITCNGKKASNEANLQSKIIARMDEMSKSFYSILEECYKTKEDGKNRRPDITVEYENSKLYIELKKGLENDIVKKFKEDVEKIEEYPSAIALCYDPERHIGKKLGFSKIKKEDFILQTKKQMWNKNIHYISKREIIPSYELTSKGKRSKKEGKKFKTNLAFAIYKAEKKDKEKIIKFSKEIFKMLKKERKENSAYIHIIIIYSYWLYINNLEDEHENRMEFYKYIVDKIAINKLFFIFRSEKDKKDDKIKNRIKLIKQLPHWSKKERNKYDEILISLLNI